MTTNSLEGFRLSPQQHHLWSLQQSSPAYRALSALLIEGRLDAERLRSALGEVIRRHEALRTTFGGRADGPPPVQVVSEGADFGWQYRDLSAEGGRGLDALAEFAWREMSGGADGSARATLLEATLLRLSETRHLLCLGMPSLCADGRSLEIIFTELARHYGGAQAAGEPMQYADFAAWQTELLEGEQADEGREYWRRRAATSRPGVPGVAQGRAARGDGFEPRALELRVAPDVASRVEEAARRCGASVEAFMLACWQTLLWRMGGEFEAEVVVGVVSDGRTYEELHGAVGLYAKALPVGARLAQHLTFDEALAEAERALGAARRWQEYFVPGEEASAPEVLFEYEAQPAPVEAAGVTFSLARARVCAGRFALKLRCRREDDSLHVEVQYDAAASGEEDAARLIAPLRALVAHAAERPAARLAELELLDEGERRRLHFDLNQTAAAYPRDVPVHQLFERQAERTPEATAVIFGDERLSYAELNGRANQLARHLRGLGVGPDLRVGICVERSAEMIVGLLGIIKSGAAYLPLDPSYPTERLAFMMEDAAVSVLLTQESLEGELPSHWGHTVLLDADWETVAGQSAENLPAATGPEHAAYVIYTSGSTGRPKGVAVTHRNLTHSTSARLNYYQEPVGNFILLPSFAFDSSVAVIFWTLVGGGALTLPREGQQRDPRQIAALIARHGVTHCLGLPSFYEMLLAEARGRELDTLAAVAVAGEACPELLVGRHFERVPQAALYNEYGPTEATVWCTVHRFEPDGRGAPIGRAIPNARVYILDAALRPVPNGAEGELYVGGEGVARGYLNRPELTAERFIPCPFDPEPGARMYSTGDVVRRRGDDNIEFVGRADQQVKLRGYRIELGEIEAVLLRYPAVRECAVALREEPGGERRLVAYVVGDAAAVSPAELRPHLLAELPEHMVPAAFVRLDALPLTPNGKVDRRALPAPEASRAAAADADFVAPRTDVEQVVARLWAEVLGIEDVGVNDNFFELGGHSLLVMQVTARLHDIFGVEVPPVAAFESPTVALLSEDLIAREEQPGQVEKIAAIVNRVENMSDEDTAVLLRQGGAAD